ncbi:TrmH family RNA methyltransferase [Microbacterium sp. G2-8]|uniref:TrmH family RNA methyltransferase n=1 Tax=Microbacterium sp. G2-8 TaxID=2842454 RepID=UPI001C893796|nr:TrmH family RNA methyltransferase [Microbacterium sp. G2-8]
MTDDAPLIETMSDPAVQRILDVSRRARAATKTLFVEDVEPVTHAVRTGVEFVGVYAAETFDMPSDLLAEFAERTVPFSRVATGVMSQMFKGDRRPAMFAIAKAPRAPRIGDLREASGDIVILDGARIVGNIGAIVRSAYGLGAAGVVLVDSELDSVLDRRVVRASRGYVFSLPVVLASRDEVRDLLATGIRSVAVDASGSLSLDELGAVDERLALVFGGEKAGHSGALVADASDAVSIPMRRDTESLNVSVAAGIALAARTTVNLSE